MPVYSVLLQSSPSRLNPSREPNGQASTCEVFAQPLSYHHSCIDLLTSVDPLSSHSEEPSPFSEQEKVVVDK